MHDPTTRPDLPKVTSALTLQGVYCAVQGGIKCGKQEGVSSIAKDLIDSEHALFCREAAFVAFCELFQE